MARRLAVVAVSLTALVSTTSASPPAPADAASGAGAGNAVIEPCPNAPEDLCGTIDVPLSWDRPNEGEPLSVRFRVFTRSDPAAPAQTPIVAFEGGPGYGSIGSAGGYRFLFEPLLRTRDLILMDQRGTGGSGAIDCPALQQGIGDYTRAVAACAEQLGDAANAYGTAAAADDLEAILDALGIPEVVLYGDSYGTYIAQVFAIRHSERTESVVLDAAFDDSFDPFARDAAAALKRSWATLCRRDGECRGILTDIRHAARRLERRPLIGTGVDSSGASYRVRVTGSDLAQLLYDATYVFTIYRDFPAALAAFEAGDPEPLLRLAAEDLVDLGGGGIRARTPRVRTRPSPATTTRRCGIGTPRCRSGARSSMPPSRGWRRTRSRRSPTTCGCAPRTSTRSYVVACDGPHSTRVTSRRRPSVRTPTCRSWC